MMEQYLNPHVKEIQMSGIRKISNLAEKEPGVINMTLGQPDFATPESIKQAGKRAILQDKTAYTHSSGTLETKEAVSQYMNRKYQLAYDPHDEIIITAGASQAIDTALRTILEVGSEVILPGPIYPGYEPIVKLCGAVPVHIDTTSNGFKLNAAMLAEKITEKTRCVILPYPSNPTGQSLDKKEISEIASLLRDQPIFVLSDEIYSELLYDRPHDSIAVEPGMREKTIIINGLSKSHAMTGWRLGFVLAPQYITAQMEKVHLYNTTCASSISQYAAIEALTTESEEVAGMVSEYRKRRDYLFNRVIDMGLQAVKPAGAFYLFPSIKKFHLKSEVFAMRLLKEEKVAVVPGSAFTPAGEGFIRLSYACSMEKLKEGADRLERFIKALD